MASANPFNSTAGRVGLLTATQNYVTAIPDYPGFGESNLLHPYMHADYLVQSILDMLKASKTYCSDNDIKLDERLFQTGYSEGGYAALAVQRALEKSRDTGYKLTAVAPMTGPYDLNQTVQQLLARGSYTWPAYVGFLFTVYDDLYSLGSLEDVFQSPYAQMMHSLFNGELSFFQINDQLPIVFSDLLTEEFLAKMLSGSETEFSAAFTENSLLDWSPVAPSHFTMEQQTTPSPLKLQSAPLILSE